MIEQIIVEKLALLAVEIAFKAIGASSGAELNSGGSVESATSPTAYSGVSSFPQAKASGGEVQKFPQDRISTIRGAGTPTSDSIKALVPKGSFIIKASSADKLVPVKLSNTELYVPPSIVKEKGVEYFEKLNAGNFAAGGEVGGRKNVVNFPNLATRQNTSNKVESSQVNYISVTVQHSGKESPDELGNQIAVAVMKKIALETSVKQIYLADKRKAVAGGRS
jgi:hypothetical protein